MTYNIYSAVAIIAVLGASLFNFWIYWVYKYNFFIGEFLIIETLLLFLSFFFQKSKAVTILIFIILSFLSFNLLINHFDKNIFSTSTAESIRIRERQQFYAQNLGKIYQNRIGIFYFDNLRLISGKISSNFFSTLDLGIYFSPATFGEFEKYPIILAPVFIIGFLYFLKNIRITLIIYLLIALIVSSITNLDSKLAPILMFPFVSLCIAIGILKLFKMGVRISEK